MSYCAIDLGATSGRILVGTQKNNQWYLETVHRFDDYLVQSDYGLIWNFEKIVYEIRIGLRKLHSLGLKVKSIGIDSWAVDYVLLNQDEQVMFPIYAYRNTRTSLGIELIHQGVSRKDLYERTGIQYQPFNTIYQLASETKDRLNSAKTFLMIPDYLNFVLTGKKQNEITNMSTTALIDPYSNQINEEILEMISVKPCLFPQLSRPGKRIGSLRKDIANDVGFECDVITVASHDTASAFIGHEMKDCFILSSGTWSLLGLVLDKPLINEESYRLNLTNEKGVNDTTRFLKNIMGLWIFNEIKRVHAPDMSYDNLMSQIVQNQLELTFDVNDESLLSPEDMLIAVNQLIRDKYQTQALTIFETLYVVLNSLADDYTSSMIEIEQVVNRKFDSVVVVGGGCQNQVLNDLIEKKSGRKVIVGPIEATAIGNMKAQQLFAESNGNEEK